MNLINTIVHLPMLVYKMHRGNTIYPSLLYFFWLEYKIIFEMSIVLLY